MEMAEHSTFHGLKPDYCIGFGNTPRRISQFVAYSRKLGKCRSSECLRSFKPSRGSNLLVLIILAGISK